MPEPIVMTLGKKTMPYEAAYLTDTPLSNTRILDAEAIRMSFFHHSFHGCNTPYSPLMGPFLYIIKNKVIKVQ
jgi:hypothetical protein